MLPANPSTKRHSLSLPLLAAVGMLFATPITQTTFAQAKGKKVALKLNLPKGTVKNVTYEINTTITSVFPDEKTPFVVKNVHIAEVAFTVIDVTDKGVHTFEGIYGRLRVKIDSGKLKIDYDSSSPPTNPNAAEQKFSTIPGSRFRLKIDSRGKVLEVKHLTKSSSGDYVLEMNRVFENMIPSLPPKPIDVGNEWKSKIWNGQSNNSQSRSDCTATLAERKDNKSIIQFKGDILKKDKTKVGKMEGRAAIDEKTGWCDQLIFSTTFTMGKPDIFTMTYKSTYSIK